VVGGATTPDSVRVLIVDDNKDFAENLAELAQLHGMRPTVATSRREALRSLAESEYDVVVLDQKLPDGRGTELLSEVRQRCPDVVPLVITAFVSLDTTVAALNEGAFAFLDKDADPEEIVATLARAAENARLRRENRSLRQLQAAILGAIPDVLLLIDDDLIVRSVNQSHRAFCPRPPADALGEPLEAIVAPFLRSAIDLRAWLAELREQSELEERMVELRDDAGRSLILGLRAIRLEEMPHPRVLLRVVDLTDRISLERRLTESEHLATLGRLVSSIAHEVRNPIAGVRALAQLMQRSLRDRPKDRENVDEILQLTARMHATLSDLLDFARPAVRREELLSLRSLLESLQVEAKRWPVCDERSVELVAPPGVDAELLAARDRLAGTFANLLENALQAIPSGGKVRVTLRRSGDIAEVDVEDDGPGIDPEILPRLFQPFVTTKTRGTGLGLSIVKKAIDGLRGTITVERSTALGGARFRVRLPCAPRA
jgi:signal transduction histidine kinase